MGVGAAAIMPTTLSILTNIFPADERPKAIAIWAAVSGMGIAIGPISGGFLIEHFAWSSIFLVNLPVVAALPDRRGRADPEVARPRVAAARPPGHRPLDRRPDRDRLGPDRGARARLDQPDILARSPPARRSSAAFVAWELRAKQPMLDVSVFRNLRFSAASISITFVFFALMGVMYFLTTYLQSVLGYSALEAGVRMLPIAVGLILASQLSVGLTPLRDEGRRGGRPGHRRLRAGACRHVDTSTPS